MHTHDTPKKPTRRLGRKAVAVGLALAIGIPAVAQAHPFVDVDEGQWYSEAVEWAYANGLTTGTSPTTFSGDAGVDRYQLYTVQHRFHTELVEPALADLEDEIDDIDIPTIYAANVSSAGTAMDAGTTDGVTAERESTGEYVVDFPRDVTDCSWTVTHRSTDGLLLLPDPDFEDQPHFDLSTPTAITIDGWDRDEDEIRVRVSDDTGTSKNTSFQLQVICTSPAPFTPPFIELGG
ncbi:MAG: S-layer homology domain-containing protein [Acidimicrobiales bacterium]|nr:S-layer homology domain-containing protein [Acidimicrobiales bacterium]